MVVGSIEDKTDSQQILQICMIGLPLQSLFEDVNCINESVVFEMLVNLFNGGLDESISFDLFRDSFEDVVDLLVILAGRIVIPVDGFLEFERFLIGSVRSVRRRNILFLVVRSHFTQTLPLASHLILPVRFVTPRTIEYIFVLGQGSLIGRHYVVMIHVKILLQMPTFFRNHIA